MKPFRFKHFDILQKSSVFRVGTDAVLLGALCTNDFSGKVLEVGTGTGVVALMVAQRNPTVNIKAIDINKEAAELAAENFRKSPFHERLIAVHENLNDMSTSEKFDGIISNPPYFPENSSTKDVIARQQAELDSERLVSKTVQVLAPRGILSVIIPSEQSDYFTGLCFNNGLFLSRKVNIYGIADGPLKRNILEFSFKTKDLVEGDFIIEKSPRNYSDQYLELTSEFHIFGG